MEIWHKLRDRCKAIPSCLQLRTRVTHCNHYFGHVFNPFGLGLVGPCRTPAISLPHHHLEPPVSCKGLATAALVTQQAPLRPPAMHLNKSWLWLWLWPDKVQPGGATAKSPATQVHICLPCAALSFTSGLLCSGGRTPAPSARADLSNEQASLDTHIHRPLSTQVSYRSYTDVLYRTGYVSA